MKLSHERMVHLTHLFLDCLRDDSEVEFHRDSAAIRTRMMRTLKRELDRFEQIETAVRRKIESQKRRIPEGSPEWEVLYRKYYDEEFQKEYGVRK
jgi:hypothetical protein